MSREIKRVALDFDWPLNEVWEGYLRPDKFGEEPCPDCETGYSPHAQHLHNLWYGKAPFSPADTGCQPVTPDTPAIRARAERNIGDAPDYYGGGEVAIVREANRLARHFNDAWMHHLTDEDVVALVEAGRLVDFTHTWSRETGWLPKDPAVVPTAAQVNEWSLRGFGHDSINASVVVRARCAREGQPEACATCGGHASLEAYPGQRAESEAWERTEPPAGEGWQFWETTTEGSPQSPVFDSPEGLVEWLVREEGYRPTAAWRLVADGGSVGSFIATGGTVYDSARDGDVLAGDIPNGTEVTVDEVTVVRPAAIESGGA